MAKISKIYAREILDSRAYPTVEAKVVLDNHYYGVASAPSGVSTSKSEAVEVRDNDKERFEGLGVLRAVDNIVNIIQPKLVGVDCEDQKKIDEILISLDGTENKSRLGVNAVLPVSIACVKAAAAYARQPLYQYLSSKFFDSKISIPTPLFNLINGGKHGAGNLDFQEFFVIPSKIKPFSSGLKMAVEIYFSLKKLLIFKNAIHSVGDEGGFAPNLYTNSDALELLTESLSVTGYHLGQDLFLGLDIAASNLKVGPLYQLKDRSNAVGS
ncbi:MAG: phosphopyruvate hydratase, partial [Nitrososphaerota archaeon]